MTQTGDTGAARRNGKSAAAFRTTGEVAEALDLPAYVLRFWESKFPQVKPLKRGGGRRYYRPQDVELLRRIRRCLYDEGYTIRGVQKLLRDGALAAHDLAPPIGWAPDPGADPPELKTDLASSCQTMREALEELRRDLLDIRALLDALVAS